MASSVAQLTAPPRPHDIGVPGPAGDQRRQIAKFATLSARDRGRASTDGPSRYVRASGASPTIRDRPVSAFASGVRARNSVSTMQAVNTITTVIRLRMGQGMYALRLRQPHQPKAVMKTSWD